MFNNQVKLTALLRSIERRSLPECCTRVEVPTHGRSVFVARPE